ncbi:MAG: hypothetical protein ABW162_10035 [Candidatus Sedimenticola sp. PURPLELP]
MKTPVLFLLFNRPEQTSRVFEAIRAAKPPRLYVAADGPRPGNHIDLDKCSEVRNIIDCVDWNCEVFTLFRDQNLGCKVSVSSAISWFFAHEEAGIILEDDCLPSSSWFNFAEEMLELHKDNSQVMCISGTYFRRESKNSQYSYYYSIYPHCWGWATWRRAWDCYDENMTAWNSLKNTKWLKEIGNRSWQFHAYWTELFNQTHEGNIDTWDYQWVYSCWLKKGLTVIPRKNLVRNIGFGPDATHTRDGNSTVSNLPLLEIEFPLRHPSSITQDIDTDKWDNRYRYEITTWNYTKHLLKKIPLLKKSVQLIKVLLNMSSVGRKTLKDDFAGL